tara:strand:+ start:45 stop:602 length:558 start_codon:yes stop_codon:yes gene_type:complete
MAKGVQGNQAAQARMFAHDAREVQLIKGAATGAAGMNSGVVVSSGSGYTTSTGSPNGWVYGVATTGGSGSGLTVDINISDGSVAEVFVAFYGNASYVEGETLTISTGGANATFKCYKALPNTDQRGACLYIGIKMASITVKMESGNSATFKSINAGSFLPVLVTEVSSATVDSGNVADNDVIALY